MPLFGRLMDWHWDHTAINNVAIYSASDYQIAMYIMPIGFIIALFAALCLRETHCTNKNP